MSEPPRLLLVSYFYPPTRDTGAQRPAAMAKWLARIGWDVTVLTTGAFGGGAATEPGVRVLRARDLQTVRARLSGHSRVDSLFDSDSYSGRPHPLSKLVVPEPLALAWAPFARRAALAAHRDRPFDVVLTTSPPESAHTIGHALHRRGVRWVADVRDAWTFEPLRPAFPTGVQRRLDERLERYRLSAADRIVCVSEPAAADLRARGIGDPVVIANAWDPDGEPGPAAGAAADGLLAPDRTSLLYTGRFGSYGRDPGALVEAAATLAGSSPELAGRLELAIAGPLQPHERELFERRDLAPVKVSLLGSLPRETSLALQRRANALLLLAQPARSQLVNFKLFEYLAAGVPILALAAGTEAGRIAADAGVSPIVAADDPEGIATALAELLHGGLEGPDPDAAARYGYPAAAEAMAAALTGGEASGSSGSAEQNFPRSW
ncbi:MAG: glycosyltransferase [Solirubrobacterales bacterium]|nr:glycosyltransferase [Solirubrobacterales bacterium]